MQEALLYFSAILSLISVILLLTKPLWGVMGIFIARPFVDATWGQPIILDFKLTELISSFVPLIIVGRMILDEGSRRPFKDMPLKWFWIVYSLDSVLFSSMIMFDEDWRSGLQVLMRHLNGIAGFYMVQAYCRDERDFLRFAWAMTIAGFFPMATGLYENLTGYHWSVTVAENDVVRNIGLYHDAITIRYFALQTILSLFLIYALGRRNALTTIFCLVYGTIALVVVKGAYSKSGFLTVGSWLLLWPLLRKNMKALGGMAAAVAVVALYYSKEVVDSFGFVFEREVAAVQGTGELQSTFAGRWSIWKDMANEWQSRGVVAHLFGAGHNANGAHNDYLQVLFHGGWIGLCIYVALLCAVGWRIWRLLRARLDIWAIAALFAYIMWIVDAIGLVPSVYSGYQWFVWGVIGFCLRYRQDESLRAHEAMPAAQRTPRFANLVGAS